MTRKSVIEEPEYHGRGDKSTITYYDLIIPVILHRAVGGPKISLSKKIAQLKTPQFDNRVSEGFLVQEFLTVPDVTPRSVRAKLSDTECELKIFT